ncbi:MAG: NADH-ubiquinone oxidoreductase-F iron-sulfur binding region domain-containing protein [Mycobacterium sp.]
MSTQPTFPNLPIDDVRVWDPRTPGLIGSQPWQQQSCEAYLDLGGYTRTLTAGSPQAAALAAMAAAPSMTTLRGRGGAAFPAMLKLRAVAEAGHEQRQRPTVVANGAEGEPLSYKDRYLLRYRPHLVLDGLLLAAAAVDAETAYVYVADAASRVSIAAAVTEIDARRDAGPTLQVVTAQDTYVAGEETAVVRAIMTGIARPKDKPPRPYQVGINDAPTLVLNVETLAWIARAMAPNPPAEPSGFLATVSGPGITPRLYELPTGVPLGELVRDVTGQNSSRLNVLMGGFFGGIVPVWPSLPLSFDAVSARGSSLGCGSLHFLDPSICPVKVAADVVAFYAEHNARQCRACMSSSSTIAAVLASMGKPSRGGGYESKLPRWSSQLRGSGACAVPDGVAVMLRTLLRYYPGVISRHIDVGCSQCLRAHQPRRWEHLSLAPSVAPSPGESAPMLAHLAGVR